MNRTDLACIYIRQVGKMRAGFSLLEMMIVLTLSSTFVFAVYQLFFHQQQQYHHQQAMLVTQENTRLALHILQKNLSNAGEAHCQNPAHLILENQVAHLPMELKLFQGHFLYGYHGDNNRWDPPLPAQLAHKVSNNTDVVVVEKASYARARLARAMLHAEDPIHLLEKNLFKAGEIVLIADCTHADLFMISPGSSADVLQHLPPENHSLALNHLYGLDAQVMRWQVDAFYLAPTSRDKTLMALYQYPLLPNGASVELVFGVENLAVEYALLQQGIPIFSRADDSLNWSEVRGVLLHVLSSAKQANVATYPYFWLGQKMMPEGAGFYWPGQLNVVLYYP